MRTGHPAASRFMPGCVVHALGWDPRIMRMRPLQAFVFAVRHLLSVQCVLNANHVAASD